MKTKYWMIIFLFGICCFFNLSALLYADQKGSSPIGQSGDRSETSPPEQEFITLDDLFTMYQPYINNIRAYQPMYFLLGTQLENSKFQFSFKYRFFNPKAALAKKYPWIKGFHLAFTQTSFWDLSSESLPFEDTSYKPEIFLLTSNIFPWFKSINRLFIQTGFQHESNGRGDENSRSTNHVYIEPIFVYYHARTKLGFQISPRAWFYAFNTNETNKDLSKYRGYWRVAFKLGKADSFVFDVNFHKVKKGSSTQIDFTYPLNEYLINNLDLYLHVQYTDRLAESLLQYEERTQALRIGFAIIR